MNKSRKKDFFNKVFITNNAKETQSLGENFGKVLRRGNVVCLYGDLGSGKTTFVQGVARGLGIKKKIISPTFIIIKLYKLKTQNSKLFYHIDLYRIEGSKDIEGLGLEEILNGKESIAIIEWAEKLKNLMPAKRIDIKFLYEKENVRKVTFS